MKKKRASSISEKGFRNERLVIFWVCFIVAVLAVVGCFLWEIYKLSI